MRSWSDRISRGEDQSRKIRGGEKGSKKRKFLVTAFFLTLFLFANILSAESVEELITEAMRQNSEVKALEKFLEASGYRPSQVRTLPDPIVTASIMNLPTGDIAFDRTPMTQKKIQIMQKFPAKGKLELKGQAAERETEIILARLDALKNRIRREVRKNYYSLQYFEEALRTIDKNIELVKDFLSVAETRYATGKGIQQDVLKAQVELSRFLDKRIEFERRRAVAFAKLNNLLDRPSGTTFSLSDQIGSDSIPRVKLTLESLHNIALEHRPLFRELELQKSREKTLLGVAYTDYKPDYTLGLAYSQRDDVMMDPVKGEDFISFSVGFNLPIRTETKQDKKVLEQKARIEYWEKKLAAARTETYYALQESFDNLSSDSEKVSLYTTALIPQAEHSLFSARSGYAVGKVDFVTLIHNQITLFNYELERSRLVSDYLTQLAMIEFYTGVELQNWAGVRNEKA